MVLMLRVVILWFSHDTPFSMNWAQPGLIVSVSVLWVMSQPLQLWSCWGAWHGCVVKVLVLYLLGYKKYGFKPRRSNFEIVLLPACVTLVTIKKQPKIGVWHCLKSYVSWVIFFFTFIKEQPFIYSTCIFNKYYDNYRGVQKQCWLADSGDGVSWI